MLLGLDDTDSLEGGCTTHAAVQLALRLHEEFDLVLMDHPRLVRLNPSNPWKTRGNAALALRLGLERGEPRRIGWWAGEPIDSFPDGREAPPSEEVIDVAWRCVEGLTWREDGRTNPGLVLATSPTPEHWYRQALHTLVEPGEVEVRLSEAGLLNRGSGSRRGLIGALAALAWPGDPHTWELLAYRARDRWGTPREVDPISVEEMDRTVVSTFDSLDAGTGALTMVPASPCPVLFGIRGREADDLPRALSMVASEDVEGWMIFITNQATDEHLQPKRLSDVVPYESVAVHGMVTSDPRTIEGGHVLFALEDDDARIDVAAYEPTKGFRDVVRLLVPGDRIVACGSVRPEPRTLNMEKFRLVSMDRKVETVKLANPACPDCGKSMKSVGTGAGFRCARCGTKADEEAAVVEERPRDITPGWYEVPGGARRHLARPLQLGVRPDLER